jgi:hypothetical protein
MMTKFHEGQEVEIAPLSEMFGAWRKAKIIGIPDPPRHLCLNAGDYAVEFLDGYVHVFDEDHIRAVVPTNATVGGEISGNLL